MIRVRWSLPLAALAVCLWSLPSLAGDPTYDFSSEDPAMQSAISEARSTLPVVLRNGLNAQGQSLQQVGVKVKFTISDNLDEIIWVTPFARTNSGFRGTLANAPQHMPQRAGDTVTFTEAQIADWTATGNGKLYGNYTTRVMLPQVDAATAASLREILSRNPVPPNWK